MSWWNAEIPWWIALVLVGGMFGVASAIVAAIHIYHAGWKAGHARLRAVVHDGGRPPKEIQVGQIADGDGVTVYMTRDKPGRSMEEIEADFTRERHPGEFKS